LGIIAQAAKNVAVMYAGKVVESSTVENIFDHPLHPYTQGVDRIHAGKMRNFFGSGKLSQNYPRQCSQPI